MRLAVQLAAALLLATLWTATAAAGSMVVAAEGVARVGIYLATEASPTETTAARELADYLGRATGARFEIRLESDYRQGSPAILVGPTSAARESGEGSLEPGEEEWVIRTDADRLLLFGGRPRGTLYAVYEFLERHVGVRWWTPYEETIPFFQTLKVAKLEDSGVPAFSYRDISLGQVSRVFSARSRLNGHFASALPSYGGARTYGPPNHVHTFYLYVPPDELLEEHPDYFSEIAGLRYGGEAQLCLTHPDLPELVADRMARRVAEARREAAEISVSPPLLFSFSQNDWARPCACARCREVVEREGSESGPVIGFVNELARLLARKEPAIWIDTLAYQYTLDPPATVHTEPNVVVRVTGLHERDFGKSALDPANARYSDAVEAWTRHARHLWIWDYSVVFGDFGDFPLPNLRPMAEDYAWYLELGVEGIYLQAAYPIAADLRDLKLWVAAKLMSNPRERYDRLIDDFTRGYYGPAGRWIRRYLKTLDRAARRTPSRIGYIPDSTDYRYLDGKFFRAAHRQFDRAEQVVADDRVLLRRIRHARLSLDRATLVFRSAAEAGGIEDMGTVAERYRATWREQLEIRGIDGERQAVMEEVEREIRFWAGEDTD